MQLQIQKIQKNSPRFEYEKEKRRKQKEKEEEELAILPIAFEQYPLEDEGEKKNGKMFLAELKEIVKAAQNKALSFAKYENWEVKLEYAQATENSLREVLQEFCENPMRSTELDNVKRKVAAKRIRKRKKEEEMTAAALKRKHKQEEELAMSLSAFEQSLLEDEEEEKNEEGLLK